MNQTRMASRCIALVVFLGAAILVARDARADTEEGARKHATKANQLAAKNKCQAAIFEFTRALKTLTDPSLLFNRAECFRKVGRNDEAISDYEQFLAEMPEAPNRAAVQARIAALRGTPGATPKPEAAPAAKKEPPPAPEKAPTAPPVKPGEKAAAAPAKEPPTATPAKPADKTLAVPTLSPTPAKPADKTLAIPMLAPTAPPAKPTEKPAEKAPTKEAAPAAAPAKPAEKAPAKAVAPAAPPAKPAEKAPAEPARRAEKWID